MPKGIPLPQVIDGYDTGCITVFFPDNRFYRAALFGAISQLGKWYVWERGSGQRAKAAAAYWKPFIKQSLDGYEGGCITFSDLEFQRSLCELQYRFDDTASWKTAVDGLVFRDGSCWFTGQVAIGFQQQAPNEKNIIVRPDASASYGLRIQSPFSKEASSIEFASQGYDVQGNPIQQSFNSARIENQINQDGASQVVLAYQRQNDSAFASGHVFGRLANGQFGYNLNGFAMAPPGTITGDTYNIEPIKQLLAALLGNGVISANNTTDNLGIPSLLDGPQPTSNGTPGSQATVTYDAQAGTLTFVIPTGPTGPAGPTGPTGPAGPPGEDGECPECPDTAAGEPPNNPYEGSNPRLCNAANGFVDYLLDRVDDVLTEAVAASSASGFAASILNLPLSFIPVIGQITGAALDVVSTGAQTVVDSINAGLTTARKEELVCLIYCYLTGLSKPVVWPTGIKEEVSAFVSDVYAPLGVDELSLLNVALDVMPEAEIKTRLTAYSGDDDNSCVTLCEPCPDPPVVGCDVTVDFDGGYTYEFNNDTRWSIVSGRSGNGAKVILTSNRRCYSTGAGSNPGWYRGYIFIPLPPDCTDFSVTVWLLRGDGINGFSGTPNVELATTLENADTRARVDTKGNYFLSATGNTDGQWEEFSGGYVATDYTVPTEGINVVLCVAQDAGGGPGPPVVIGYEGPVVDDISITTSP